MKIFISYARLNRDKVEQLQSLLERAGHDAWFDQEISGGEDWWRSIINSIKSCDVFLFALSPESTHSEACRAEFRYAIALNKPILPVMLKQAELPTGKLRATQYVDGQNLHKADTILDLSKALTRLGERINKGEFIVPTPHPPEPKFPFPPDPLENIRPRIQNLSNLPTSEVLEIIYDLQRVSSLSSKTSNEAHELLERIANDPSLPNGVVRLAKATLETLPTKKSDRTWYYIAGTAVGILLLVISAILLTVLVPPRNDTNRLTQTAAAAITWQSETAVAHTRVAVIAATASATVTKTFTIVPTISTATATDTPSLVPTGIPTETPPLSIAGLISTRRAADALTATASAIPVPISIENMRLVQAIASLTSHDPVSTVRILAFSPDMRFFASGSNYGDVKVWNTATRDLAWLISPTSQEGVLSNWITGLAFSSDGQLLAIADEQGTLQVWDVARRSLIYQTEETTPIQEDHTGMNLNAIWCIDFSPDDSFIAVGLGNGIIELWASRNRTMLARLQGQHEARVRTLDINSNGLYLVSSSIDGNIKIREITTGEVVLSFDLDIDVSEIKDVEGDILTAVKFSPDGQYLAVGSSDGVVRMWDWVAGEVVASFIEPSVDPAMDPDYDPVIWDMDFTKDGTLLAIATTHNYYLWGWQQDINVELAGHTAAVRSIDISSDDSLIVTGSGYQENKIRLWSVVE